MFKELPHEFVSPKDLKEVTDKGSKLNQAMKLLTITCSQVLELFMLLLLTWKTIWSMWTVASLMLKILLSVQRIITLHSLKRYQHK